MIRLLFLLGMGLRSHRFTVEIGLPSLVILVCLISLAIYYLRVGY